MNAQTSTRIQSLLQASLVLAAELGTEFIHSDHGQALFQKIFGTVSTLANLVPVAVAAVTPNPVAAVSPVAAATPLVKK